MRRFAIIVLTWLVAASASAADSRLSEIFSQWETLRAPETESITFNDGIRFLTQHPGWPEEKIIRLRTEVAALTESPERERVRDFCLNYPPISGRGMMACVAANAGDEKARDGWLHQGWVQGDFSENEEQNLLARYGDRLKSADHAARMERLLYEGKASAAKRMLRLTPAAHHPIYQARMALMSDARGAMAEVKKLSTEQRRDAGILFDRIKWRAAHNQEDELGELFLAAPDEVPYPDLWWSYRAMAARQALATRDYGTALSILSGHGDMKPEAMADALFLKGWITLEFKHDAASAYKDFFALYGEVATPVSKARAAYWAARAAHKNGNADIAREWFDKAASHPTVFYGQLAYAAIHPGKPLKLPDAPSAGSDAKSKFEHEELVGMTRQLASEENEKMRDLFLNHLATAATTPERLALVAALAQDVAGIPERLRVAKAALRRGVVLLEAGWPRMELPREVAVEPALALAIIRQESEFDPLARSSANARGLMQLLPATARQVARKNDLSYDDDTLDNPQENMTLGALYLGKLVSGFDGSYILGIASYNAGPGNVRNWIKLRGTPPENQNGALNWIESIPFAETRNYVMRALENVQIYRSLASPEVGMRLEQDLVR